MTARPNRRRTDPEDSEAHVHRRTTDSDAVLHLHSRVADCEDSIVKLLESHREMAENMKLLTDNIGRVADALETWSNVKGFWAVMKFASSAVKTLWPIAAFFAAIWLFIKTGRWVSGG